MYSTSQAEKESCALYRKEKQNLSNNVGFPVQEIISLNRGFMICLYSHIITKLQFKRVIS